ncbi:unnamed protein product [Amaranthus hypochondriacus]
MEKKEFLVPTFGFFLGAIAVVLSILAYIKSIKVEDVDRDSDGLCVYPSSPASVLGIMAALFLLSQQILISVTTYCFCCGQLRCSARCTVISSLLFFVCSWITFVIAFMGLLYTSILNNTTYLANAYPGKNGEICNVGESMLFLAAALLCVISNFLGLICYGFWACSVYYNTNNNRPTLPINHYHQDVVVGQPQTSQPNQQC